MSEFDLRERPWRFLILDMIVFSEKVLAYTEGMDRKEFLADGLIYDATLRNLQLIGAAAKHVPIEVRQAQPEIPWHIFTGTCNNLVRSYLTVSDSLVWDIIQEALPGILPPLRNLADENTKTSGSHIQSFSSK